MEGKICVLEKYIPLGKNSVRTKIGGGRDAEELKIAKIYFKKGQIFQSVVVD